jgi:hypothetical protein
LWGVELITHRSLVQRLYMNDWSYTSSVPPSLRDFIRDYCTYDYFFIGYGEFSEIVRLTV